MMSYGVLLHGGPILAGLQVYLAFKVWRHALRNVTPRVDGRPLAVGMVMFTVGWLIAALGAAGHYPWDEDAVGNSSFGIAIFIFGSPVAFGILLLVGIPGTVLLLRKGRLGYAMGLLLVAVAIAGSAIVVWWRPANQWHATHRLESFLGALRAMAEYMLPPAVLGVVALVFVVRSQQRAGGAPPEMRRPARAALRASERLRAGPPQDLRIGGLHRDRTVGRKTRCATPPSPSAAS